MKTLLTSLAIVALFGTAAYASGLTDPVVEPEVIVADAVDSSSNHQIWAALALVAIILGAAGAI